MKRDILIAAALFFAALALRLVFASQLAFPPLDDPAFYIQTARSVAYGRGLVSDVIWSYQFPFAQVTHPSHEYWMPLATFLMAPFIRLLGDWLWVAQLPGIVCGALLVAATYGLGRMLWPDQRRLAAASAALLIAAALPVYQSASADSSAPFALFGALALMCAGQAITRRSVRWGLLSGLAGGVAYLARSDGLLIPLICIAYMLWRADSRRVRLSLGASVFLGASAIVTMWWLRNLAAFGTPQPVSPWTAAALADYGQLFNWNDPPTWAQLLDRGWGIIVDLRAQALLHNLGVWALIAFPFGLYGWVGLLAHRHPAVRLGSIYALTLLLVSAIVFSVPTLAGLFYHSAGATLPWLAVGSVEVLRRLAARRRSIAVAGALATVLLIVGQAALAWPGVIASSRDDLARFSRASSWLREHVAPGEPIIATQAHSLNYASGIPALTLPNGQGIDTLRALADRYGARFVVISERVGLYPDALDAAIGGIVRARYDLNGILIYELSQAP